jgi:signal recognition particle subunit SRP54
MFDALSDRLRRTLGALTGRGRVSEADVEAAMRDVRLALLEADVNFKVVKDFTARVRERAIGAEVLESLNAGQQVVKIVHEELTTLLSGGDRTFHLSGSPAIVALVGLQGSGKTTSAAKLARHVVKTGRRPLLVAADPYRPAAVEHWSPSAGASTSPSSPRRPGPPSPRSGGSGSRRPGGRSATP